MNKNINKDSWDFIDYCNAYLISNEFFFEDFERVLLPTLPSRVGNRQAFKAFRTQLASKPRTTNNRLKIDSLERLNNSITLQEQKQRSISLENDIYVYKNKVDESIGDLINKLYDFNFEFNEQSDEVNNKLNLILDEISLIKKSIESIENDKDFLKKILQTLDYKLDNLIDLSTALKQSIKDEFSNLLKEIKNLFNISNQEIKTLVDKLTNLIKNNFQQLNNLIIEKFLNLNLNIDTILSILKKTADLIDALLKEFKLFDFIKLKDLLIKNKNEIIDNIIVKI